MINLVDLAGGYVYIHLSDAHIYTQSCNPTYLRTYIILCVDHCCKYICNILQPNTTYYILEMKPFAWDLNCNLTASIHLHIANRLLWMYEKPNVKEWIKTFQKCSLKNPNKYPYDVVLYCAWNMPIDMSIHAFVRACEIKDHYCNNQRFIKIIKI